MWPQEEAEKAEVTSLLDALLDMQRQRRAREKAERLLAHLAHMQGTQARARQAYDGTETGRFDGIAGTMENIWGRASDVQYDAEDSPSSSSFRPLSFTTSFTTATRSTLSSVEYGPAVGAAFHAENQDRINPDTYGAAPHVLLAQSFSSPSSSSNASSTGIPHRGFAMLATTSKASTEKVSWGNRVGRKIRAYGRQIMGHA